MTKARRVRGLLGPGEHLVQGRVVTGDPGLGGQVVRALAAGFGRGGVAGQEQGDGRCPQAGEGFGVAGHGGMQDFPDLEMEDTGLQDQVVAMTAE
jgi:hypothetical protein